MKQPLGFENPHTPHYICKLDKAPYGLKQAPRPCYSRLSSKLCELGTLGSHHQRLILHYFSSTSQLSLCLFLFYVDDIIVTGSSDHAITALL
jgi:histone deacetylase 1/2